MQGIGRTALNIKIPKYMDGTVRIDVRIGGKCQIKSWLLQNKLI